MADLDPDAERRQPIGRRGLLLIRSAHRVTEIREQLGDAAHADTADPDEVHATGFTEHDQPTPTLDLRSLSPRRAARAIAPRLPFAVVGRDRRRARESDRRARAR